MGKVVVSWLYLTCPCLTINVQGVILIQKETTVMSPIFLEPPAISISRLLKNVIDYSVAYNDSNSQNYLLGSTTMEWKDMIILSLVNVPYFAISKK